MKKIFKYQLKIRDWDSETQKVLIPKGFKILCIKNQRETIVLYAEVNDNTIVYEEATFHILWTGESVEDTWEYVGTVMIDSGSYVLHIYKE